MRAEQNRIFVIHVELNVCIKLKLIGIFKIQMRTHRSDNWLWENIMQKKVKLGEKSGFIWEKVFNKANFIYQRIYDCKWMNFGQKINTIGYYSNPVLSLRISYFKTDDINYFFIIRNQLIYFIQKYINPKLEKEKKTGKNLHQFKDEQSISLILWFQRKLGENSFWPKYIRLYC